VFVFIEDSGQSVPHHYSLRSFGSLWVDEASLISLESEILKLRIRYTCWGEIKWQNVDHNHAELYKEVLNIFHNTPGAKFNSIICKAPTTEELNLYHGGDDYREKMKLIYQLVAYNYSGYRNSFCSGKTLKLIADEPFLQVGQHREDLLNNFTNPNYRSRYVPIESARKAHSHISGAMQMTDLLTGLSLVHCCKSIFPGDYSIGTTNQPLVDHALSLGLTLDPVFTGRPSPDTTKVNNWFHLPRGTSV